MKTIILLFMFMQMLQADESVVKVVFDLTTSDIEVFERNVLKGIAFHKTHYEGSLKELSVAVVIHGGAYKFFIKTPDNKLIKQDAILMKTHKNIAKRIALVADLYEAEFLMCKAGLTRRGLKEKDIYSFVKMVPTSTVGLIDKQGEGYAYIPIGK